MDFTTKFLLTIMAVLMLLGIHEMIHEESPTVQENNKYNEGSFKESEDSHNKPTDAELK